jgi:lysophospholipase L1-like esterase
MALDARGAGNMKIKRFRMLPGILLLAWVPLPAGVAWGQTLTTSGPATQPTTFAAPRAADQPSIKFDRYGRPNPTFVKMHQSFLERAKAGPIGILFLGDSITQGWTHAPQIWKDHYGKYNPANFGIGGDHTEHVLWRIDNGELDGISPRVVVLLIGTNNFRQNSADEIAAADRKIVAEIHQKLPQTKVLVIGIFPRGADPTATNDHRNGDAHGSVPAVRAMIKQINNQLAALDDGKTTRYLDVGPKFLNAKGEIPPELMKDALHPTESGYRIWADAMQPLLDEMMK